MNLRILSTFFLTLTLSAAAPKPLLVVVEQNPWLMVIGSDSPTFVLYNDGTLIYLRSKPTPEEPFHRRTVSDSARTKRELIPYDISKMAEHYELSAATDQITTIVWTPEKRIEVYGGWRKPRDLGGDNDSRWKMIVERERKMWESLPENLRKTLYRIDELRGKDGIAWLPTMVEVMFWPYEYAPDESIVWPKEWPGLSAPNTKKRGKDSYSIFLSSERYDEFRRFLKTRKEKGAILIDGRKMAESHRFPFPEEELWMK